MSYVKPLAIAAALVLSLTGMEAIAATHTNDIIPPHQSTTKPGFATYYVADAGTAQAHKVYYFKKLDRNHDGQLSRSEVPKDMWRLRAYFQEADFNGNGRVSLAEYYLWSIHAAPEYTTVYHAPTFVWSYND